MDDNLTSDTWIESNDGDNFVKGGFLYEKGFWGRKVRRIVLTEKSFRILVPTSPPPLRPRKESLVAN
jgi:hypothetical protein